MSNDVVVREIGLRDGLQGVKTFFPTASKKAWIDLALAAGVSEIEVSSFVPTRILPQFADAEEVVSHAMHNRGNASIAVLVPNEKGATRAFPTGVSTVAHVVAASESFNQANVRRSIAQGLRDFESIIALRDSRPEWKATRVVAYVSTAFGCSIEGSIDPDAVIQLVSDLAARGAQTIYLSDTVGYANPAQVKLLFRRSKAEVGDIPLGGHFHDTRGLGLANVTAALDEGVRIFDSSMAGLGGCPYAPGATGNIVTEDLVYMLESMGLRTGIDIEALFSIRELIAREIPDEILHGATYVAKLPKGFRRST